MAALLVGASAIPNLGNELNMLGGFLNFYRVVVALLAVLTLILFRGEIRLSGRRSFLFWMGFLFVWLAYAGVLMVGSPYTDSERGIREIFSLLCGLFCFYILSNLKLTKDEIELVLRFLFFVLTALVLLGFGEIITGKHLSSSMYSDPNQKITWRTNLYTATGFSYNINDYSALITLMLPVTLGRFRIRLRRFFIDPGWFLVASVVLINRINDANICNAAILVGVFAFAIFRAKADRRKQGMLAMAALAVLVFLIIFTIVRGSGSDDLFARVMNLIEKSEEGKGSLQARMLIYRDGFSGAWVSGLLGLGPGGFYRYYSENPSGSNFVDPHSLFLEILSQYGVLIFAGFVLLLIYLFRKMRMLYRGGTNAAVCNWGEMGMIWILVYSVVTFASSSYLQNSFHWTLLALICLMFETAREEKAVAEPEREPGREPEKQSIDLCIYKESRDELS